MCVEAKQKDVFIFPAAFSEDRGSGLFLCPGCTLPFVPTGRQGDGGARGSGARPALPRPARRGPPQSEGCHPPGRDGASEGGRPRRGARRDRLSLHPPPGLLCEENVDDCARGPRCLNGGQCVDRIGGYSCRCLPGFAGAHCEGDINECLSSPCSSEGSLDCVQLVNDYRCVCRSAFTGERPAPRLPGGADDGDPGPVRRRPDPREASLRREKPGQPESRARLFLGPVLAPCTLQSRSTFPFLPRRVFSFVIH